MVWAALAALLVAGCGSGSAGTSASPPAAGTWSVVAVGDSVPAGNACGCTPYPTLTAAELAGPLGRDVVATDDAVGGYTTEDVLHQLQDDGNVVQDVRRADLVEIEVGANDVSYSTSCGTTVACYSATIPSVETNLRKIVRRVHRLTAGRPVHVVLLDYWSAWLGGAYARAKGEEYLDAAGLVTDEVNTVIRTVAAHTSSMYVDLRAAFKGPDYRYDETHYLASDGDHPNALGHEQIASALVTEVAAHLHLGR